MARFEATLRARARRGGEMDAQMGAQMGVLVVAATQQVPGVFCQMRPSKGRLAGSVLARQTPGADAIANGTGAQAGSAAQEGASATACPRHS